MKNTKAFINLASKLNIIRRFCSNCGGPEEAHGETFCVCGMPDGPCGCAFFKVDYVKYTVED